MTSKLKYLVICVDRDNDFGDKAGIASPVIGLEKCIDAGLKLAVEDPEDSDVNCLFAAIKKYEELQSNDVDVEIVLICGHRKVGQKSDDIITNQLEEIKEMINPDRVVIVSDGPEDEYVNPIISSQFKVSGTEKVYVKQSKSIEGTYYIISRMIKDYDKRKRFLVPLGLILVLVGFIFFIDGLMNFIKTDDFAYIYSRSWPITAIVIGIVLMFYGYNVAGRLSDYIQKSLREMRKGNMVVTFTLLSIALFVIGIVLGIYSVWNIQNFEPIFVVVMFLSNALWPVLFSAIFKDIGEVVNSYISLKKIKKSFMIGTITLIGIGIIIQGLLDFTMSFFNYASSISNLFIILEIIVGVTFTIVAAILQSVFNRHFNSIEGNQA